MTLYFPQAEAELIEAAKYYEDRQSGLGTDFHEIVQRAVREIEEAPRRWPVFRAPMRRRLVPKYPYGIIYVVYHDDIVVIAIAHLSRHPLYWLERLEGISGD